MKPPADVTGFITTGPQRDIEWTDMLVPAQQGWAAKLTRLFQCRWAHRWELKAVQKTFGGGFREEIKRDDCWACKLPAHAETLWPHYSRDALVFTQHKELTDYLKAKQGRHEAPASKVGPIERATEVALGGGYRRDVYPAPPVDEKTLANIKVPAGPAPGSGFLRDAVNLRSDAERIAGDMDKTQVIPTLPVQHKLGGPIT